MSSDPIAKYLASVKRRFLSGISREHSYRGDLETLIRSLVNDIEVTNEPTNVTDCGNPDYVITRGRIPVGYIEAKDIGKDLASAGFQEQFTRYRSALDNLLITDYLRFQYYQYGELIAEAAIAEIRGSTIQARPAEFRAFSSMLDSFCAFTGQTIRSPRKLAEMMAAKARFLESILERALTTDEGSQDNSAIRQQFESFKSVLIHDLSPKAFSDIYAQTLAYGMFAARLHDPSLNDFSRQEAAELIPRTNPFLRKLFQYVAGYDIDPRIRSTVDNLAEVFRATNVDALLQNFGKSTQTNDPIIHFYETFLAAYDPEERERRGVWYTPEPVVRFMVSAVDDILRDEFRLGDGLADTSTTTVKVELQGGGAITKGKNRGKARKTKKVVHKVQVLDPAAGTGTFLAAIITHIHSKKFGAMQGAWSAYVDNHLIPRLNGFELLMAPYAMAHLKLDMLLRATGYVPSSTQRFNVFLTNSLEEHHPDTGTLFASWLSSEANEANHIKRDTPVMVVIGNPPYSGESANKGEWIMGLMDAYKKEPGGEEKLKERNPKWINDDYVKFLRYGQHYIERNGEGVLAFINPHGFLDNPTFRGMRWELLRAFDKIYILDLHGNAKKKESAPDGSPDINVFDIQQGVSINLFVKTKKAATELADVYHADLFGSRESKYQYLANNTLSSVDFQHLPSVGPSYFMVPKDFDRSERYYAGFSVKQLFLKQSMGVTTGDDKSYVTFKKSRGDRLAVPYAFRPFDLRYCHYDTEKLARAREASMENLKVENNIALCLIRRDRGPVTTTPFCTRHITDKCILSTLDNANIFPLYVYATNASQLSLTTAEVRMPNFDPELIESIAAHLGAQFSPENADLETTFAPLDVFDYIYSILHSQRYVETYRELLRADFPFVPYPDDLPTFRTLTHLGGLLRKTHLLEFDTDDQEFARYPENGDNLVSRRIVKGDWEVYDRGSQLGRVWINDKQHFDHVPQAAWDLHIGGYQPAQKWLKERRGIELTHEDVAHYQRIITALVRTAALVEEINQVPIEGRC